MERFWLTEDEAFQLLRQLSSRQEVKLHDIAAELDSVRAFPRDN